MVFFANESAIMCDRRDSNPTSLTLCLNASA